MWRLDVVDVQKSRGGLAEQSRTVDGLESASSRTRGPWQRRGSKRLLVAHVTEGTEGWIALGNLAVALIEVCLGGP